MTDTTRENTPARRTLTIATVAAGLVLAGLALVLALPRTKGTAGTPPEEPAAYPDTRPAIPPIDAAAPADIETATFALG